MNLNTLAQGESWMTPEERGLNRVFVHATAVFLADRGVPETPLILIRVNDIIATWLLARRLESALAPKPGAPAPCPTPAQAGAIGKCRDRLRRAMKDLEACCPRDTAPVGKGLFERLQEVTEGYSERKPASGNDNHNDTQTAESTPDDYPNQNKTPETESHDPKSPKNLDRIENHPTPQMATEQSESRSNIHPPTPSHALPSQPTQPAKPLTRQRKATKKRRKKRGIPSRPRAS